MNSPNMNLNGDRIRLRPMTAADMARLAEIRSSPEVREWWPYDDLERELSENLADEATCRLVIELGDVTGERVVGLIQFDEHQDPEFRHASIDIYIDPAEHRQGIATESIQTVVAHLFGDRGHHRITIDPAAANAGAIECYRRVGFRAVGVMQSYQRLADGTWADGLLMELLAGTV